jgi:hypothetical protein
MADSLPARSGTERVSEEVIERLSATLKGVERG